MAEDQQHIGPYRLGPLLGSGGMGSVYRAYDERLERWVALKRVHSVGQGFTKARERLRREAKAIAKLNHPSVVQIYDLVEHDGEDWLVMELVEGQSLALALLEEKVTPDQLVRLAREIALGLAAAHQRGIIHRDLKAENVLVNQDGHAKILDFGLAKHLDAELSALTAEGVSVGTMRSMAPEQVNGEPADARTDLYALGVLLYEALAGRNPFLGPSHGSTIKKVLFDRPESLATVAPAVPQRLSNLVDRLLQKEREDRPGSAVEVAQILGSFGLGGAATEVVAVGRESVPLRQPAASAHLPETEAMPVAGRLSGSTSGAPAPVPAKRTRRWTTAATIVFVVVSSWALLARLLPAQPPLQVAVMQPEVAGAPDRAAGILAVALRESVVREVLSRRGLSTPAPEVIDPLGASPIEVARAVAADEVLVTRADCSAGSCQVRLRRLGPQGNVLWTRDFPIPLDDLGVVSTAVSVHLQDAFPGRRSRDAGGHSKGSPEAYRRYLDLKHSFAVRAEGLDVEALLADLRALQGQAPQLAEVPMLASAIHRLRYVEGRQAADAEAAVAQARRAVELDPGSVLAQRALLAALIDVGRLDEASTSLEALERLSPGDPRTGMWRANLLLAQGNAQQAMELATIAAERLPAWDVLLQLADFQYRSGDLGRARDGLDKVLELFPGHYDAASRLAQIELVSGDLDRAVALYRTLVERSPGVAELTNLGVALMFAGDYQASCDWLDRALQGAPTNPDVLLNAADCRALTGDQDQARELYARVIVEAEESADETPGLLARAQAYAHLENHAGAIGAISEALRRFPEQADVAYVAALVYSVLGEASSARFHAARSLDLGLERRWFDLPWFEPIRGSLPQEGSRPSS